MRYRRQTFTFAISSPDEFLYRYVNCKLSKRKSLSPINDTNGKLITDGVARANIFNKYFASVFTNDDGKIGNIPQFSSKVDASVKYRNVSFTPLKVMQVLKGLKLKYSSVPHGLPNILL